jgi:N-acetylglucosaminyldiphosphoundecaprenol N-acetyl-beta-D-mannosaminyltransferase
MQNNSLPKTCSSDANKIIFCGLDFDGITKDDIVNTSEMVWVVPVNAQIIDLSKKKFEYREIISQSSLTFDGQIPYWLANIQNKGKKIQKISGSDLTFDILKSASTLGRSVYILGGSSVVNSMAVQRARILIGPNAQVDGESPKVNVHGQSDGEELKNIKKFKPHYLLVCFGAPKQEFWVYHNLAELRAIGVKVILCAGGSVDFLAGAKTRAPYLIQRLGLESIFRLLIQPNSVRFHRLLQSFKIFYHIWDI